MVQMPPGKKMTNFVGGPIPGMSLTAEPGSRPWEQPPQYNTPKEALDAVIPQIMSAEVARDMSNLMERGIAAEDITDGTLMTGFSEGKWTVDVAAQMALPMFLAIVDSVENIGGTVLIDSDQDDPDLDMLDKNLEELENLSSKEEEGALDLEDSDEETPEVSSMGSGMMPPAKSPSPSPEEGMSEDVL